MATLPVTVQRKLFSVDEYEQMLQARVLGEDDRLELIEGEIVEMSLIGGLHIQVVNRLTRLFVQQLTDRAIVSVQNPIRLTASEPQPDLAVLRAAAGDSAAVPTAADVLLVIEVSDTTAGYDRAVKVPPYASSGIPEAWLVDLQEQVIEVYRGPAAGRYKESQTLMHGEVAVPHSLAGVRVSVDAIFGGA